MSTSSRLAPTLPVIALFAIAILYVVLFQSWPSPFDELAQLSAIRAQAERPDLFADTRTYLMLHAEDLSQWSGAGNYINHPALYYLLLAPFSGGANEIMTLRLVNAGLALTSLLIILWAGCRALKTPAQRTVFAILAACFPKFALIGGLINNDNLAMVAAALVFAGLTGAPGAMWLIGIGLALAGWTKLTALIALGAVAGAWLLLDRTRLFSRASLWAAGGVLIGAVPYAYNLLTSCALFHVNVAVYWRPPAERPPWAFADYAADFAFQMARKWPADEAMLPTLAAALLISVPLTLAAIGSARVARSIGLAYFAGLAVTLAIHFGFGWQSFLSMGDTTIPQTRYYNVLWPGLAFAATCSLTAIKPVLRGVILLLLVVPTVIGTVILRLFA